MKRRTFLRTAGASVVGATALAGCAGNDATDTESAGTGGFNGTLQIATYSSFTGKDTAGNWLKSSFEAAHPGVTVEFTTPESGLNQYILRQQNGAEIDADLYIGLNTAELVRADQELDESLFETVDEDLTRADTVKSGLQIDPDGRAIPYDTGYISLVYNGNEVENPATFDALTSEEYQGDLIVQDAGNSDPGRAFLLWTIAEKGPDGYLDYWRDLLENDVTILSDWEPAYNAYMNDEAPMVVSYSTDQVYYHGEGVDIQKHQVGFLNDQAYANPEAMALFTDADAPDLARTFMDFMLSPVAQAEIAVRNVQFPAVEGVDPGAEFSQYAYEPSEPVTFSYDELSGNVEGWIEDWRREIAN
ncbi:thiamine ABC transporter substrate-binding protein [Halorhabdus sp. BNX81]|uniref:thiamine ABC transporter substrate-binding protein n=1 Tax=Halorhabdus sp. BNX81 TaxID=2980181 RepID=UPI0023DD0A25|nr:thiamine ABC transporter substrate-binding protein [Halorhabdus sp. BNX81]